MPPIDPMPVPKKASKLKVTRSSRDKKVETKGQSYATLKELKRIAQIEKEKAEALAKLQKLAEKHAERDTRVAKKAHLEQQELLDQVAEFEAAEALESEAAEALAVALAVEKRKPPTRRDVVIVPGIVPGKKKSTEAPMTHGATINDDFELRIMVKVNNQLESALQASVDASTQVMKELRHIKADYTDLKEKNDQLQSAMLSLCRDAPTKRPISEANLCYDAPTKRPISEVNQCERVSLEGIETRRYSGVSSEKLKIDMLVQLALAQRESTYIKIENDSKSDELDAMKALAERARNKEVNALRAAVDLKKNEETYASYLNSMFTL